MVKFVKVYQKFTLELIKPLACTIITCVWGLLLYIEYAIRGWKFFYRWSTYRPLASTSIPITEPTVVPLPNPWYCDASHWLFLVTLTATLGELIIATIPKDPYIRLLSMVNPTMVFSISLPIFLLDLASLCRARAPFRISSVRKGEYVRPGLYTLLEDIFGVDIGGGHIFRQEFNEYWRHSVVFRRLLYRLSTFWSLSGVLVSGTCTAVIFTTNIDVGFAVGWSIPFLWAILWGGVTAIAVIRSLGEEMPEGQAGN